MNMFFDVNSDSGFFFVQGCTQLYYETENQACNEYPTQVQVSDKDLEYGPALYLFNQSGYNGTQDPFIGYQYLLGAESS
jgi:hypothetical protein